VFEEFHEAAKKDQVNRLRELLSTNDNWLEKRDKYKRTPLLSAARYGASSASRFLLDRGADFNVKDESGNTPLHLASIFRHDEVIDLLIRHKADVNVLNNQGHVPLSLATIYGNPESIRLLLAGGAKINFRDADGNTPLHIAVLYRHPENLAEILKVNSDIDEINTNGYTPLLLAVQRPDNEEAIGHLLQNGADVNLTPGRNALLVSVGSHQKGYIALLVSRGIDINSQDNEGNTALHYPLMNVIENKLYLPYSKDFVKMLMEEGADPSIRNKEGISPMDLAAESGENELIDLLISKQSTQ